MADGDKNGNGAANTGADAGSAIANGAGTDGGDGGDVLTAAMEAASKAVTGKDGAAANAKNGGDSTTSKSGKDGGGNSDSIKQRLVAKAEREKGEEKGKGESEKDFEARLKESEAKMEQRMAVKEEVGYALADLGLDRTFAPLFEGVTSVEGVKGRMDALDAYRDKLATQYGAALREDMKAKGYEVVERGKGGGGTGALANGQTPGTSKALASNVLQNGKQVSPDSLDSKTLEAMVKAGQLPYRD